MTHDTLKSFIEHTRAAFGSGSSDVVASVRAQLERLAKTKSSEGWLRALHDEPSASKELYRDGVHGFVLLAHTESSGLYRSPHDHGRAWVIYALQRGEMEIGTYARVVDAAGLVRLTKREAYRIRAGDVRVYLPGEIHDTRCVEGPSLLFRFTERDLRQEEQQHRLTRYVARDGVWTVASA